MRLSAMILAIAGLVAAPTLVLAAEPFTAPLTTAAEVPPVTGDGSGTASVTISDDETEIAYEVTFENLTGPAVAAHIHYGDTEVAGGVIFPLAHSDSPMSGTLTEADFTPLDGGPQTYAEALAAIRDGMTYINVHTEANQGGEIRGQLRELPDTAASPDGVIDGTAFLSTPAMLLALFGAAVLILALRRISFVRR